MDINFYKQLLIKSTIGYAYHKVICDATGAPYDYEFIEVNPAFERITGLNSSDIIGKRVTEVLPGIRDGEFDWINYYGRLALECRNEEFETYSEPLKKWYKVNVISTEIGFFVTKFIDVSKEYKQVEDLKKITTLLDEYLNFSIGDLDYKKITSDLLKLSEGKLAGFNLYDDCGKEFTTVALAGESDFLGTAIDVMGMKLEGKKWEHDLVREQKIKAKEITRFDNLGELIGTVLPKAIVNSLLKTFNIGEVIVAKITRNGKMLGDFTIVMPKGKRFEKENVVNIFVKQIGLIIERKKAESELSFNNVILKTELELSIAGVLIVNKDGEIVAYNKKFIDYWGIPKSAIDSKSNVKIRSYVLDKLVDPLEFEQRILLLYDDYYQHSYDEIMLLDGRVFERYSSPMTDNKKNYYGRVWYYLDITERKLTERELITAREKAEHASKAKSDFLSSVSHEIRTPMNAIIGLADVLEEQFSEPEMINYVRIIQKNGAQLLNVINDVLDISKIESGKLEAVYERFSPYKLIKELEASYKLQAEKKGLELNVKISSNDTEECYIFSDMDKMRQIIINLIGNAIKFTEIGKVELALEKYHVQLEGKIGIRINVSDTGIGIKENKLDKIFDSFEQAESGVSRTYGGTGLGLTISRQLAQLLGGNIYASSKLGEGSQFHLDLVCDKAEANMIEKNVKNDIDTQAQATDTPKLNIKAEKAKNAAVKILVAEDNEDNRLLIKVYLNNQPVEIDFVENGQLAVEAYSIDTSYCLILMDMQMPIMGGLEATSIIRNIEKEQSIPATHIVALTANAMNEDREKSLRAGCDEHISKPVKKKQLLELVEKLKTAIQQSE